MERRRRERAAVQCEIMLARGAQSVSCWSEDMSLHGARVWVNIVPPLKTGERISLSLTLPDLREPLSVTADVRWVSAAEPRQAGIEFVRGLRAIETWALTRLFDREQSS